MVIGMFLDMNLSRRTRAHAKKDATMLTLECATASCDCKRYLIVRNKSTPETSKCELYEAGIHDEKAHTQTARRGKYHYSAALKEALVEIVQQSPNITGPKLVKALAKEHPDLVRNLQAKQATTWLKRYRMGLKSNKQCTQVSEL